jgi:Fe-S cluster biogenesis protein NfuA
MGYERKFEQCQPRVPDGMNTASELPERIQAVIKREARDGGLIGDEDVELVSIDSDNIVQVRFHGGCGSCPATLVSLLMALEQAIKAEVPEIKFVEAVP